MQNEINENSDNQNVDQEITSNDEVKVELAKIHNTVTKPKVTLHEAEDDDAEPEGQLTIDVYQTPHEIVVESAIAGVDPEKDLDINITADSITIRGRRRRDHQVKAEDYFYQECYWGRFSRSVILPQEIDSENAYASFKNGVLSVHLPKFVKQRTRKIKVKIE